MFVLVSFGTMDPSPDTCSNLLVVVLFWMISGLGRPNAVRDFDNHYGQLVASKKCCRRFGFLDDTLDHGDRLDGLHRSFCPVSRLRIDPPSP